MNASYEVDLLSRLVAIESNAITKSGYFECSELVRREAEDLGLRARIYDSRDFSDDKKTRPNVVIDLNVGADETVLLASALRCRASGNRLETLPFQDGTCG